MKLPPETDRVVEYLGEADALAVVGCWAKGTSYPPCEVDLFAIGPVSSTVLASGGTRFRVLSFKEGEPKSLLPLAGKVFVLNDSKLKLMTLLANRPSWYNHLRRSAIENSLMASLTNLARCEESLLRGNSMATSFWLMVSVYDYCHTILHLSSAVPSPSHMLDQIRAVNPGDYPFIASSLGLDRSTKVSTARRVTLAKELSEGNDIVGLTNRVEYLLKSQRLADAFFYQGLWLGDAIKSLYAKRCDRDGIPPLYSSINHELPEVPWRMLGLSVDEVNIRETSSILASKAKALLNFTKNL